MTTDDHCEMYALLTRLSANAMRQGDRRTAAGYAWGLGIAPREPDSFIPANVSNAFIQFMCLQGQWRSGAVLMYRRAVSFETELN